jgi:hypothetical protein
MKPSVSPVLPAVLRCVPGVAGRAVSGLFRESKAHVRVDD